MKPLATDELIERLRCVLAARPEVLEAYLFGSSARGEREPHSDVDVAVYLDRRSGPGAPYGAPATLAAELMTTTGEPQVDVVVLNEAPPLLYGRVVQDGVRFLSRDLAATTTREGRALSRYCDFVPHLAKIDAAHRARILRGGFGR